MKRRFRDPTQLARVGLRHGIWPPSQRQGGDSGAARADRRQRSGKAWAAALTPERLKEIAQQGASARWKKEV